MENFDPVAYRNQFKPDGSGLAGIADDSVKPKGFEEGTGTLQPAVHPGQKDLMNTGTLQPAVHPGQKDLMNTGGGQQMPNFYQQPMGMMPFGMGGFNPMGMFMNPYGGLGGMAYNFMNSYMPLYSQGGQFQAGEYTKPEPIEPTQPSFGGMPFYGGFSFY